MNAELRRFIEDRFIGPGKALDLGAGDFTDVNSLRKDGWQCEGVDIKTGVDLEKEYLSPDKPFDLVFANYVIHKIKNKDNFISTFYNNLKPGGLLFIHTFDESDENSTSRITSKYSMKLLEKHGFVEISAKVFDFYDADEGHKHWHKILEITAKKP